MVTNRNSLILQISIMKHKEKIKISSSLMKSYIPSLNPIHFKKYDPTIIIFGTISIIANKV